MGFKPGAAIYNLSFEAPHLRGLEVSARSTTLGKLKSIMDMQYRLDDPNSYTEAFEFFADRLVKWNIEHPEVTEFGDMAGIDALICAKCGLTEDDPMPPNFTSLMCLDPGLVINIIRAWIDAVAGIEVPKGKLTPNGGITEKHLVTLPTEMLPIPNLTTSHGQS
jgi:hypothetical protein